MLRVIRDRIQAQGCAVSKKNGVNKPLRLVKGFTLIELLIVIGILAVLATLVILVINPNELFKQARDVRRLNDVRTLTSLINYAKYAGKDIGPAGFKRIDVSITGVAYACDTISTPAIFNSWARRCAPTSDYLFLNGLGWLEVNVSNPFAQAEDSPYLAAVPPPYSTTGSIISQLPIDPINTGASGYYYMYLHDAAKPDNYSFVVALESQKYQTQSQTDGGYDASRFETGSDLTLWKEALNL